MASLYADRPRARRRAVGICLPCSTTSTAWSLGSSVQERLGVGWVSFYREPFLRDLLDIPATVRPVAWLCLGPVTHLEPAPDLERHGWRQRRPLPAAIHHDRWTLR